MVSAGDELLKVWSMSKTWRSWTTWGRAWDPSYNILTFWSLGDEVLLPNDFKCFKCLNVNVAVDYVRLVEDMTLVWPSRQNRFVRPRHAVLEDLWLLQFIDTTDNMLTGKYYEPKNLRELALEVKILKMTYFRLRPTRKIPKNWHEKILIMTTM